MTRVSLITIGTELLKGTIVNTNAAKAGQLLRRHGFTLHRVVTIADEREDILNSVHEELAHSELVLVSGGLGPTKDDITKHVLAELFGYQEWVWHQPTLDHLEQRYRRRGRPLNELTRRQALVPDVCMVLPNRMGTAPAMHFAKDTHHLYAMPGVPFEMLTILEEEVIPHMRTYASPEAVASHIIRIAGVPESEAAKRMESIEEHLPAGVSLAYLPRVDGIWLEVSKRAPAAQQGVVDQEVQMVSDQVFDLFREESYTRGSQPLAQLVQEAYMERGLTLALAESMTGGQVAATLVSVSGASHFFRGSVTAYSVEVKESLLNVSPDLMASEGVVSAEVAAAMARGVRAQLGADVGLAITGWAEADGDTAAQAWLGYADEKGTETQHISLIYDRPNNISRATNKLLIMGLQKVRARF